MNTELIELPIFGKIMLEKKEEKNEYLYSYGLGELNLEKLFIDLDINFKVVNAVNIANVSEALNKLKELNNIGLTAIDEDFAKEGEAAYYIKEWKDNIFEQIFSEAEFLSFLADTDAKKTMEARLLSKLKLVRVGVYSGSNNSFIVLDYAFGYAVEKGFRDDMLVIMLDKGYQVKTVVTEG